jgi:hypothetical protein
MFNMSNFKVIIYVGVKNSEFTYRTTFIICDENMWINF